MTRAVGVKRQNTLENTGVLCSALVKMTCRTPVNKMLNYLGDFFGGSGRNKSHFINKSAIYVLLHCG